MLMPGRQFTNGSSYRYGFNGQEKDNEVAGVDGANTTAEFWEYNSRLGRRWNVDPVAFPSYSPFATFYCSPNEFNDPNGDVGGKFHSKQFYKEALNNRDYSNVRRFKGTDKFWHVTYDISPDARDKYDGAQAGNEKFGMQSHGDIANDIGDAISDWLEYGAPSWFKTEVKATDAGG